MILHKTETTKPDSPASCLKLWQINHENWWYYRILFDKAMQIELKVTLNSIIKQKKTLSGWKMCYEV